MTTRTLLIALLVLVVAGGALALVANPFTFPAPVGVACTQEAMQCPDGSYVGRTGPNCEFTACPVATSTTSNPPVVGEGEHCGGFIQNAPVCATDLHCQLKVSMPDTGGTCVADTAGGGGVACTADAMQCPDGSYVGRTGPDCKFVCPTSFAQYHSGIRGTVLLGPTCPVMRNPPDPQCADRPYATQISVARTVDPTHPIATTQSDAQGAFQVTLSPGDYVVSAAGGTMLPRCSSTDATVSPNAYTSIAVSCDTGIR